MPERVASLVARAGGRMDPYQMISERDAEIAKMSARVAELERKLTEAHGLLSQLETAYMVGARSRTAG